MAPARRRAGDWAILLTLSLGFFMTLLDLTIVNIAIPDMRHDLHASLAELGWVVNAYVIVLAVLMITAGRLGDLRGRRNLFIIGVAVFTLASAASGLSPTTRSRTLPPTPCAPATCAARTVYRSSIASSVSIGRRSPRRSSACASSPRPWRPSAAHWRSAPACR